MKKILALVVAIFFLASFANAQESTFNKGDKVVNLGIGFGGTGTYGYGMKVPPVSGSLEVGIVDGVAEKGVIGIGGLIGYASYGDKNTDFWTFSRLVIGARGSFHYPLVDKLDTYAGLMLAYNNYKWTWHGTGTALDNSGGSGVNFYGFIGGRYYFTENIGAFLELGYSIATATIGVSIKL